MRPANLSTDKVRSLMLLEVAWSIGVHEWRVHRRRWVSIGATWPRILDCSRERSSEPGTRCSNQGIEQAIKPVQRGESGEFATANKWQEQATRRRPDLAVTHGWYQKDEPGKGHASTSRPTGRRGEAGREEVGPVAGPRRADLDIDKSIAEGLAGFNLSNEMAPGLNRKEGVWAGRFWTGLDPGKCCPLLRLAGAGAASGIWRPPPLRCRSGSGRGEAPG